MKRKELKALAEKIAKYEFVIQTSSDNTQVKEAQAEIMKLSSHVSGLGDIVAIDELVQDILSKKLKNS